MLSVSSSSNSSFCLSHTDKPKSRLNSVFIFSVSSLTAHFRQKRKSGGFRWFVLRGIFCSFRGCFKRGLTRLSRAANCAIPQCNVPNPWDFEHSHIWGRGKWETWNKRLLTEREIRDERVTPVFLHLCSPSIPQSISLSIRKWKLRSS